MSTISKHWQDDLPHLFVVWPQPEAQDEETNEYALKCEVCGNVDTEPFYPARPNGMVRCGACDYTFWDPSYDPD